MGNTVSERDYEIILENSIISAVDAVIYDEKRIFLAKRTQEPCKGEWWIPGGRQLKGESPEDAVIRKIKREIGIDIIVEKMIYVDDVIFDKTALPNVKTGVHYVARVYLARLKDRNQRISLDKTQREYGWFDRKWFEENGARVHPYLLNSILSSRVFED